MNRSEIVQKLISEGYTKTYEYNDPPNTDFPVHDHPGDQLIFILKGSMDVEMEGKKFSLKSGDELFFPANVKHSAKAGPEGCESIVGEKILNH